MTFWLVLMISGQITQAWGPTSLPECEARAVVMSVDIPRAHEYRCYHGRKVRGQVETAVQR